MVPSCLLRHFLLDGGRKPCKYWCGDKHNCGRFVRLERPRQAREWAATAARKNAYKYRGT